MLNYKENESLVVQETNAEATERVQRELKSERKLEERRKTLKAYFLEIAEKEMTEAEFIFYNDKFEKAEKGYNIKSFIKELEERKLKTESGNTEAGSQKASLGIPIPELN